ncbi:MAG: type II secretion system protein [Candidatus Sumerlaeaceae bacterium]
MSHRAFTLIELLIVVAIIAVLAAIAVPNFLEAQTRAKTARAKNDLRVIATGLEAYAVDENVYPFSNGSSRVFAFDPIGGGMQPTLERLSTPVAYLTGGGNYNDPFKGIGTYQTATLDVIKPIEQFADRENFFKYWYSSRQQNQSVWGDPGGNTHPSPEKPTWWILESCGPDRMHHNPGTFFNQTVNDQDTPAAVALCMKMLYDPTNGTVSRGSIWRVGGQKQGEGQAFYTAAMTQQR